MDTSIWLHPWDLEGWEPAAFVDRLRALGLDACQLALAYHATRLVLPGHRRRRVIETAGSAMYFAPDAAAAVAGAETGVPRLADWTPPVAPEAALTAPFLEACRDAGFPARAWIVLCHQDGIPADSDAAALCVTNVYGDRYGYALCPSQPEVREWCAALCARAARLPGVDALDVEAASFLGVDHQSAHDKRGVPLPPAVAWLLSICVCPACRGALDPPCADEIAARARAAVDTYFRGWPTSSDAEAMPLQDALAAVLGADLLRRLLDVRERAQLELLAAIRRRVTTARLMVRLAASPLFAGGKTALPLSALSGRADAAVMTWLGADLAVMQRELAALPPPDDRAVPLHGGFTLHAPDCRTPADVDARLELLRAAGVASAIAYCYGLASDTYLTWLRDATHRRRNG